MEIPKDQFGHEIKVGSIITYPCRQCSSMWMNTCLVTEILKNDNNDWYDWHDSIFEIKGLIEVKSSKYTDDFKFIDYERRLKKITFYSCSRATIINPEMIKEKYPLLWEKIIEIKPDKIEEKLKYIQPEEFEYIRKFREAKNEK